MSDLAELIRRKVQPRALPAEFHDDVLRLQAAVSDVLDVHEPMPWFEECMDHQLDEADPDAYEETHRFIGDAGMSVCDDTRQADRCRECTPEYADDDTVMSVKFPCSTVRAIASALGVREDGE